ncbi:MAG: penicillin-binding protein 2 [Gemmatimonadota bacterium]|nr:penicillin-binding protein 2 [Gemmatimonadota bacterium]MDH3422105.1 penicillin-binding protein 2 [Gemmatimonadota bacterium]
MSLHLPHERQRRALGAQIVLVLVMASLAVAFFRIQVLRSNTWELRANANRIRQLPIPTPRGVIYDRQGRILADNVPGYAITLLPGPVDSMRATLARLSQYMDLPADRVSRILQTMSRFGREVIVDGDADFEVVAALEERRGEFPGVYVEMRPRRRYLLGNAAAHVLGYVGEITAEELVSGAFEDERYEQGMIVGKGGIEEQYEARLQGRQGLKYVEFDARGRIVGDFTGIQTNEGEPGQDLYLNIDLELQEWIHHIFPDSMAGAVVALDPSDGGVLAIYSAPTYDPNAFVGGISQDLWDGLRADPGNPLFDRAVLGRYPPGSTWKLAAAAIALDLGVVTPDEEMEVACTGGFFFGDRYFRCWDASGHGMQNLAQAIGNSCDVYFYQLGLRVGLNDMLRRATDIGFSQRCGVDLPQESQGIFPSEREWWNRTYGYSPREGEVLNLAIGQGPNSQTPLKMAQFYVALAGDGSAPAPAIAQGVELAEGWSLNLAPEHLEAVREGLRRVTAPGGTAHVGTALEHWEVIGKTGTAEHELSQAGLREPHAWFAGMAGPPGGPPEIVIAVIVEYGDSGSGVAAPIMAKTADFYLRRKYGIPVDSVQTYGEHLRQGRPTPWYTRRYPPPPRRIPPPQLQDPSSSEAVPTALSTTPSGPTGPTQ